MKRGEAFKAIFGGFGMAFGMPTVRRLAALLLAILTLATFFYHWVEGWRLIDAAYFSVVTVATVGYGDLAPKTDIGKVFTIFLILGGIGLFVATASAIAEVMIDRARQNDEKR
jgi:voltage-gated potassium channel